MTSGVELISHRQPCGSRTGTTAGETEMVTGETEMATRGTATNKQEKREGGFTVH